MTTSTFFNWCKRHKELLILIAILIVAAVAHGYNMFHYPYYEDDEGTYMSQAWAVLTHGTLAPYTYWYDHAPAGWFLIALWNLLTGGFFTFGVSVNSGRVLMLVLHLASTAFLFLTTKKITKSTLTATIAALLFSLTPLGIYYQRRVLLDNIMTFWFLLSLYLVTGPDRKLRHFFASAITFAIAMLSKESAVFFLPVFLYIVYQQAHPSHRRIAIIKWFTICGAVTSFYILYALLKGELFPSGTFLGGNSPHVSLLGSLAYQSSRAGGFFLNQSSSFVLNFTAWVFGGFFSVVADPIIMIGGIFSTFFVALISIKNKTYRPIALLTLAYWLYLIRGGEVISFYIIPLIPLLAVCIAITIQYFANLSTEMPIPKNYKNYLYVGVVALLLFPFGFYYSQHLTIYTHDQTTAQIQGTQWIEQNVPRNAIILMDNYAYVDLHGISSSNVLPYDNAEYYWKADTDPAIKQNVLDNTWTSVDYILATPQLKYDAENAGLPLALDAFNNSIVLQTFPGDGYTIEILKVTKPDPLKEAWSQYYVNFINPEGRTVGTGNTTSEGQSYALLRAVWTDDQTSYDSILHWTLTNLQHSHDNLFSWLYGAAGGTNKVLDPGAASDADEDIALSLVLASREWNDPHYLNLARPIIDSIWSKEVVKINGRYYIAASDSPKRTDGYLVNPSYISPAAYRIFAQIDTGHPWGKLATDSYYFLNKLANLPGNTTHLPPNEVLVTSTGSIQSAVQYTNSDVGYYGFDAFRVLWRVALDWTWFQNPEAKQYLQEVSPFFESGISSGQAVDSVITLQGKNISTSATLSTDSGMLSDLLVTDKPEADKLYGSVYESAYNNAGYWGDKTNYYDQNWAWFTTALYEGSLSDFVESATSTSSTPS